VMELFPAKWHDEGFSLSRSARQSIVMKQQKSASEHASPFVLDHATKFLHGPTIRCWVYGCAIRQASTFACLSQETVHMILRVEMVCVNLCFFGLHSMDCSFDSGVKWDTHVSSRVTI
jgi:hypothetical protein